MELLNEILDEYIDAVQPPESCTIWIAGGAPRDCILGRNPKDIDVYLLTDHPTTDTDAIMEHVESAYGKDLLEESETELHTYRGNPLITPITSFKINGFIIQTMVSAQTTIKNLLNTFDWNICRVAWNQEKGLFDPEDLSSTMIHPDSWRDILLLRKVTNPFSNLRRGYRFSERYGFQLHTDDIATLCSAIMKRIEEPAEDDPHPLRETDEHKTIGMQQDDTE